MQGVGGRGKRGAILLPDVCAGTGSRKGGLRAATSRFWTRDGHRGGAVDGHRGRGRVGATVGAARHRNRLGADRVNLDGICIGASGPGVARSTTCSKGHSSTMGCRSVGAAIDGNRGQGRHLHKSRSRGRTTIGGRTRNGVITRGRGVRGSRAAQIATPYV